MIYTIFSVQQPSQDTSHRKASAASCRSLGYMGPPDLGCRPLQDYSRLKHVNGIFHTNDNFVQDKAWSGSTDGAKMCQDVPRCAKVSQIWAQFDSVCKCLKLMVQYGCFHTIPDLAVFNLEHTKQDTLLPLAQRIFQGSLCLRLGHSLQRLSWEMSASFWPSCVWTASCLNTWANTQSGSGWILVEIW